MLTRHQPMRRTSSIAPRRATARRSSRLIDDARISWLHTLPCAALALPGHVCDGPIEADHVGERGLGQKCSDAEAIALCRGAHRDRHDHRGVWVALTREQRRAWLDDQIERHQRAYARHLAGLSAL